MVNATSAKGKNQDVDNLTQDLLIEIGMEELPPKNLENFANTFGQNLEKSFKNTSLAFSSIETFIAPRRLAAIVKDLVRMQPEQTVLKRGPAKVAAFDSHGKPTQAALGFASSCQTTLENIGYQDSEKGTFLVFEQKIKGQATETLIPNIVQTALDNLPIAKRMRWGERVDTFVRPVHWMVLLFGNTLVPAEFFGVATSNATRGHRFHHPKAIPLPSPSDYEDSLLKTGKVIASYTKRRNLIEKSLQEAAAKIKAKPLIDQELLDQVTGLVEWPVLLVGQFDTEFLKLPESVLITSMKVHQKCFPVVNEKNELLPQFLIVSNIESSDPKTVIQGNERVMHARLHDAAFYYRVDKEISLEERREGLKNVVFQQGLGTLWDKSERIAQLSSRILQDLTNRSNTALSEVDINNCKIAAELCKADLLTQMVMEFPELQGIMGRHYYLQNKGDKAIAAAIEDHYYPRFADDQLPNSLLGAGLAIADRIDTLVGIMGLGKRPTGDSDPFALRRQALAVLRIILEEERFAGLGNLDLSRLLQAARQGYEDNNAKYGKLLKIEELNNILLEFFYERLRAVYHEQGIPARVFDAVLANKPTKPRDFDLRLKAVTAFQQLPEAESLNAANKRVRNILEKNEKVLPDNVQLDDHLFKEEAEKHLAKILLEKEAEIKPFIHAGEYTKALSSLAKLKEPIDAFFDTVMVMVDDVPLRNNRLKLLKRLRALFLEIADISVL